MSTEKSNVVVKGVTFSKESYEELKKVHPPTKQETIQATIVVLVMIVVFAGFLGLADISVGALMERILGYDS